MADFDRGEKSVGNTMMFLVAMKRISLLAGLKTLNPYLAVSAMQGNTYKRRMHPDPQIRVQRSRRY